MSDNEEMFAGLAAHGIVKLSEAHDKIEQLEAERDALKASREADIRAAFRAGAAWQIGQHQDFQQIHPDIDAYVEEAGDE